MCNFRTRWLGWKGRSLERYFLKFEIFNLARKNVKQLFSPPPDGRLQGVCGTKIGVLESHFWIHKCVTLDSQNESRRMSEANIDSKLPTRKPSAANSANSSAMPSRNWSRHSSPTRGEILRMEDEMHTVNRLDEIIFFSQKQSTTEYYYKAAMSKVPSLNLPKSMI